MNPWIIHILLASSSWVRHFSIRILLILSPISKLFTSKDNSQFVELLLNLGFKITKQTKHIIYIKVEKINIFKEKMLWRANTSYYITYMSSNVKKSIKPYRKVIVKKITKTARSKMMKTILIKKYIFWNEKTFWKFWKE